MNKEIYNELLGYPLLMNLKSENPFRVPDDYFEKIEYSFLTNESGQKNVPEGYFEELPSRVIAQVDMPKRESKTRFLWPSIGVAAASLALLFYFQPKDIVTFTDDDTWAYVIENQESYDMNELIDLFEEEDLMLDEFKLDDDIIINQFIDDIDDDELESLL